jgi:nitroimidazol reductase NimA-like FMN-containing flavoprotein (pyridoxamine 5'-phosphate oxidase superfamily)
MLLRFEMTRLKLRSFVARMHYGGLATADLNQSPVMGLRH